MPHRYDANISPCDSSYLVFRVIFDYTRKPKRARWHEQTGLPRPLMSVSKAQDVLPTVIFSISILLGLLLFAAYVNVLGLVQSIRSECVRC